MPTKQQFITQAAQMQAQALSASVMKYAAFLETAANNYKYSFSDQLFIFMQKPNATACAEMALWNRLGRWVNKGAKGIALLTDGKLPYRLRYVFDISDTNSRAGRAVHLWKMRPEYETAVRESLCDSFGVSEHSPDDFPAFLTELSAMLVEDNYADYLSDLQDVILESRLEELNKETLSAHFRAILKGSISYMLLSRCGYAPRQYVKAAELDFVKEFNTTKAFSALGSAVSDIAEMALRDIELTVKDLQKNRTFENRRQGGYTDGRNQNEGSTERGNQVHTAGRLSDTGAGSTRESEGGQVRDAAPELSDGASERDLQRPAPNRGAEPAPRRDRPSGRRDGEPSDAADGTPGGRDRTDEGEQSHALGTEDGEHPEPGRGDRPERPDLQLKPEEEQIEEITQAEVEKASAFTISQEDIDAILTRGSGIHEGKYRIYEQYLKQESSESNISFLKNEYGIGGAYPAVSSLNLDESHDAKGIKISRGKLSSPEADMLLSWKKAEKRIGELIAAERYLSQAEKEHYPTYRAEVNARKKRGEIAQEFRSIVNDFNDYVTTLGEKAKCLNQYYLSSCWGAFQSGEKKMYARTMEGDYILPMMREAMQTIIAENTHLTGRCKAMLEALNSDIAKELEPDAVFTEKPEMAYHLSPGDTVYLGIQEYEILSMDDTEVVLYDTAFPLLNKVMPKSEFDAILAENPLNDRFLQSKEGKEEPPFPYKEGDSIYLEDGKEFIIEDVGELIIRMRDPTMFYPISRSESRESFAQLMKRYPQDKPVVEAVYPAEETNLPYDIVVERIPAEKAIAPPAPKPKPTMSPTVLYPEINSDYRTNFKIRSDSLGVGTSSERYYHNTMAIRLLHKLEDEHRLANELEQDILSDYVGWGGLADCFDEHNSHYEELKSLLTPEEYTAARESTLTAFYTPPVVIRAMYQALEQMNFKAGNILEPSCGIGNFIGMLPESMAGSRVYGVELDSISGRIARQLYQKSSIAVQGFEKTELPDSFFDCAIGNVPFGQFKVADRRYDKYNFLIHDYFFARALDKVRPGGMIAFITSKGTMDKENPSVRRYIAQRADLLGAIRLPNNTFKSAAGTEVTADILFLQKRDRLIDQEPDWVHLGTDSNGVKMNQYFVNNPDMILGEMKMVSGPFGLESACIPYEGQELFELLHDAVSNIHGEIGEYALDVFSPDEEDLSIPADPTVRNFSYTLVNGKLYFRENSRMNPVDVSVTAENRINSMIVIRNSVRRLIEYQTEDYPESYITNEQKNLNRIYDEFTAKYGLLTSRANSSVFRSDSSYFLLCSLEILDNEGKFVRKADMFSRRTIKQKVKVTSVDTASEALALSLAEKAKVDLPYMMELTGKTREEIENDLKGVIFLSPEYRFGGIGEEYLPADEYLSGNVREKLRTARQSAESHPLLFSENVKALEAVQPQELSASEISVRLGTTWIPTDVVEQFVFSLFGTPRYCQWNIHVHFSKYTGEWNIEGKTYDRSNVKAYSTYGTNRINGYKIIEETLNLKDVRIFDYVEDSSGHKTAVLNKKETAIAQGKQELIKAAFAEWIWADPERRAKLCKLYNEKFNSIRPREYDGSHLNFVGINPEITLRPHQVNAIAHILYGGNTLLAHVVGAGKTFEMVAAAQESKRLGLCRESLFVVPNHLTEQWASEYLQLYPSANILVATKKDFEAKNRKKFCARIATGEYDAIIIGHSQFEKIPMSIERQQAILEQQKQEIIDGITELKNARGDRFSVKQLEKSKKSIELKLAKLNDQSQKDDVVTFEELGVDRLFVDEAHGFKNLAVFTKMRNVGGISQTEAMKSSDLYMKCRYLDELTGGRGIVFATGTPISNSMVEIYTMQKYLQYGTLQRNDLLHFDAWASTFGETVTAIELAPEGSGYRSKTRFAKFYNLPELMAMFKETADIQTADMLNLPVPKANYHNVVLKPSEQQKAMVQSLSDRAEKVRNKMVSSDVDNMLLITNDGRKLALDQRLMNPMLPDHEGSKSAACAQNVYDIWERTSAQRSTQMIFCDLSTPHNDGSFNVYDDIRNKLIAKGIPAEEIAYIHNANSEAQKKELFGKVRSGQIRVLMGSTQKMGAGTNVQSKLIALHHTDCPWRPSDLQQREGRIIRQGNENPEVDIYTYVTENTFDSYLYQLVESKQKFIGQIMTAKSPVRSAEDIDETALSYAEIKALCTGNPLIKEKMDLDIEVQRLKLLKANHLSQRYSLEDQIIRDFPQKIAALEQRIAGFESDMAHLKENTHPNADGFCPMVLRGRTYTEKKEAGAAIIELCRAMTSPDPVQIGQYRGFTMELYFDPLARDYRIALIHDLRHTAALGTNIYGNIPRLDNVLDGFTTNLNACRAQLENTRAQLETAKVQVEKPFPYEDEFQTKSARLAELNATLDMDKHENEIADSDVLERPQTIVREFSR